MTNNAARLKRLVRKHELSRSQIVSILGVVRQTVNSWLAPLKSALSPPHAR